ncbi:hypothetical protein ACFX13_025759 [Malus domestica]
MSIRNLGSKFKWGLNYRTAEGRRKEKVYSLWVVAAVVAQQPQGNHDLHLVELPWSWVGHSSSGPSWVDSQI